MRRAGLFFALPDEADVGFEGDVLTAFRALERGELGKDCCFVVAGAASEDAMFAVDCMDDGVEGWKVSTRRA